MKPENSSLLLLGVGGAGATTVRGVRRAYGASIRALTVDADAASGTSAETPFVLIGGDRLAGRGAGGLPAEARAAFLDKPDVLDAQLEGVRTAVVENMVAAILYQILRSLQTSFRRLVLMSIRQ